MTDTNQTKTERAGLVSVLLPSSNERETEALLDELERLTETAGAATVFRMTQTREAPDVRTYIGSGKIRELAELCSANEVTLVIFDTELSPAQIRNIENDLEDVRVIDRSMLILDIFALHAKSNEGKLQVELAQLKYTVPRLIGKGLALSRQGGGSAIASRGPGETQLETDRRHVRRRMQALEEELADLAVNRNTRRKQRDRTGIPKIAIAGYTNAGKSTLLNRLTGAGIPAEDKLFATLDPTARKLTLPDGNEVLLIDTVGFIRNLPHHLIEAFRSTLDEVRLADIILVMTDASDPEQGAQLAVTDTMLRDLECDGKPVLYVFNKCDKGPIACSLLPQSLSHDRIFYVSAATGEGIDRLMAALEQIVRENTSRLTFCIPLSEQAELSRLYRLAKIESTEYGADSVTVTAVCDERAKGAFRKWIKNPTS